MLRVEDLLMFWNFPIGLRWLLFLSALTLVSSALIVVFGMCKVWIELFEDALQKRRRKAEAIERAHRDLLRFIAGGAK